MVKSQIQEMLEKSIDSTVEDKDVQRTFQIGLHSLQIDAND